MKIQSINSYSPIRQCKPGTCHQNPSFHGWKGFIKGAAIGAGVTAAGVAAIGGAALLPVFGVYYLVNGAIAGGAGALIENQNKKDK